MLFFSATLSRNSPLKHLRLHLLLPRHYNLLLYSTTATSTSTHQQPPPIQVSLTESSGRGVFATRRIGAGDLIHTAKPFISYPSLSLLHCVCYFCLKKIGTVSAVPSSVPKTANFCSHECKKLAKDFYDVEEHVDWSAYDAHCRTRGLKYPLLMKRLACMVISGATSADCLDILQPARLLNEMILEMEVEFDLLKESFTKSNFKDEVVSFLTREWYTSVLARIRINAFRVEVAGGSYEDLFSSAVASVEAAAAVGNAVYMLPSFYNHDCDPNVHIIWIENVNARLKALRDIEEGEELRICYIDASMDHDARQTILSQGFGFKCTCARCVSGD